jgi:hypothetical protein
MFRNTKLLIFILVISAFKQPNICINYVWVLTAAYKAKIDGLEGSENVFIRLLWKERISFEITYVKSAEDVY